MRCFSLTSIARVQHPRRLQLSVPVATLACRPSVSATPRYVIKGKYLARFSSRSANTSSIFCPGGCSFTTQTHTDASNSSRPTYVVPTAGTSLRRTAVQTHRPACLDKPQGVTDYRFCCCCSRNRSWDIYSQHADKTINSLGGVC